MRVLQVWRLHPSLAGVLLLGVLARSAFSAVYGTISREISDAQQDALASASAVALQGLSLVQTVRAYGTQRVESERYGGEVRQLLALQNRQGAWYGLSRVVTGSLNAALLCGTLGLSAALVARGVEHVPRDRRRAKHAQLDEHVGIGLGGVDRGRVEPVDPPVPAIGGRIGPLLERRQDARRSR